MNRCQNTGINREKPFLEIAAAAQLRAQVDRYIDQKIDQWNATIPFAEHFQSGDCHVEYYKRFLIETALRIRLLRVSESKALASIAKISPEAAQIWANYEREEMLHDRLFLSDYKKMGGREEDFYSTEPYLSTKLLTGFFSYMLDHEGPLGVVAYSYLVEYVNVKLDSSKIKGLKKSLGEKKIIGQISHANTDTTDDHPGEVWQCLRYLIRNSNDIQNLYQYFDEHQEILGMFFREIYADVVSSTTTRKLAG